MTTVTRRDDSRAARRHAQLQAQFTFSTMRPSQYGTSFSTVRALVTSDVVIWCESNLPRKLLPSSMSPQSGQLKLTTRSVFWTKRRHVQQRLWNFSSLPDCPSTKLVSSLAYQPQR